MPDLFLPNIVNTSFFVVVVGTLVMISSAIRQRDLQQLETQSQVLAENETLLQTTLQSAREANERLSASLYQLEQRNRETVLLADLGEMLQACSTPEEAYPAIAEFARQLFPAEIGALYVYSPSRDDLERVVLWGHWRDADSERVFAYNSCWALKRGRVHVVDVDHPAVICQHIQSPPPPAYVCVPLIAHGEVLGVLHIRQAPDLPTNAHLSSRHLAMTTAEHVALALANLRLRETLRHQSIRDPLTGLFNRRYMEETLGREIHRAARLQNPLSVLMLDLDHFKRFNDTFGHDAGDAVLRELGAFLLSRVRRSDIACRYGGEEFVLILPDASAEAAFLRAEEIRRGVKELNIPHNNRSLGGLSFSVGVVSFPHEGATSEAILKAADMALYTAKQMGRDRVVAAGE